MSAEIPATPVTASLAAALAVTWLEATAMVEDAGEVNERTMDKTDECEDSVCAVER